jgi:acetylornithine deacetylase/succinyl-diaminopimelate desuccinylase-like protein
MYGILREQMQGLDKEVIDCARELVRTPSVSLQEEKAAEVVERRMKALGYDKVFRDDFGNVLGLLRGRDAEPTVLLNSHLDTVEAGPEDKWSGDPLSGEIRDGRLYGLGAADCKSGLAAQIYAGALLNRSLLPMRGNLVVAATVAEENGLSVGVQALMEKTLPELGLKPSYAILGECTGLGLYYGHDGWLEMEIRVEGSNPFHVDDAVRSIYNDLTFESNSARGEGRQENMLVRFPRFETPVDYRGVRMGRIEVARRMSQAEEAGNVVTQLKHEVAVITQPARDIAVDVSIRQEIQKLYNGRNTVVQRALHAWATDPFHPLIERSRQALTAAGCTVKPGKWQLNRLGMGTAGSVLSRKLGIPTVGYGPGGEEQAHSPNEYVETAAILEAVYGTASIVHSLIGIPVYGWTSDEI